MSPRCCDAAGVHAPHVLAQDLERGFLLLTDLGTTTYLRALDADNANDLFGDAIDALLRWQLASRPDVLPPYDEALLRRELELFPDWYVGRHLRPGAHAAGARRPRRGSSRSSSRPTSRSRRCSCTATTCRAT